MSLATDELTSAVNTKPAAANELLRKDTRLRGVLVFPVDRHVASPSVESARKYVKRFILEKQKIVGMLLF